jgi:hypothetical protein
MSGNPPKRYRDRRGSGRAPQRAAAAAAAADVGDPPGLRPASAIVPAFGPPRRVSARRALGGEGGSGTFFLNPKLEDDSPDDPDYVPFRQDRRPWHDKDQSRQRIPSEILEMVFGFVGDTSFLISNVSPVCKEWLRAVRAMKHHALPMTAKGKAPMLLSAPFGLPQLELMLRRNQLLRTQEQIVAEILAMFPRSKGVEINNPMTEAPMFMGGYKFVPYSHYIDKRSRSSVTEVLRAVHRARPDLKVLKVSAIIEDDADGARMCAAVKQFAELEELSLDVNYAGNAAALEAMFAEGFRNLKVLTLRNMVPFKSGWESFLSNHHKLHTLRISHSRKFMLCLADGIQEAPAKVYPNMRRLAFERAKLPSRPFAKSLPNLEELALGKFAGKSTCTADTLVDFADNCKEIRRLEVCIGQSFANSDRFDVFAQFPKLESLTIYCEAWRHYVVTDKCRAALTPLGFKTFKQFKDDGGSMHVWRRPKAAAIPAGAADAP